jgi:hypothetical protein
MQHAITEFKSWQEKELKKGTNSSDTSLGSWKDKIIFGSALEAFEASFAARCCNAEGALREEGYKKRTNGFGKARS